MRIDLRASALLVIALVSSACGTRYHRVPRGRPLPESRVSHERGAIAGAGIGLVAGAVVGAVIGATADLGRECGHPCFYGGPSIGGSAVVGGGLGLFIGAIAGGIGGTREVYVHAPLRITPVANREGAGAAASFAF